MPDTYVGTGKMTAIYLGSTSISKVYVGTELVFGGNIPNVPQVYDDFYVGVMVQKNSNNTYDDFYVGSQIEIKI